MLVSTVLPVADGAVCGPAARQAEDDGFDSVPSNELRHDPFAPLAFAALATERVDSVTLAIAPGMPAGTRHLMVQAIQRIPYSFPGTGRE